ncbi:DUF2309 domain-containing protein [Methylocaldum gracile]
MLSPQSKGSKPDVRRRLQEAVCHLDHVLPGQAPILNFVHHNTLHGYQHLPFQEALESVERLTGVRGYLPEEEFRKFYAQGRILDEDLAAAFAEMPELGGEEALLRIGDREILRRDVYRIAMVYGVDAVTPSQLNWQIEEMAALDRFQSDIPPEARHRLMDSVKRITGNAEALQEAGLIRDLWDAGLTVLGLEQAAPHPEDLTDLTVRQAENLLNHTKRSSNDAAASTTLARQKMRTEAHALMESAFADVGRGISLRGLLAALTGRDVLDIVRPILIRFSASHLDEGLAAWHAADRREGLYSAWRRSASYDLSLGLCDFPDWRETVSALPEQAVDAVHAELIRIGLPENRWETYLERLALELPGWSGIINWRQHHPDYEANREAPASLMDYLAIRLVLDRLAIEGLCREIWGIAGTLPSLRAYFERNPSEFLVRHALCQGRLPEYLADCAQQLVAESSPGNFDRERWWSVADMISTWKHSALAEKTQRLTIYNSGWRLFRLAQHLGVSSHDVRALSLQTCEILLAALDDLSPSQRSYLWLSAYERRYREELFNALANNRGRGRWAKRDDRPDAQVVFCIDDREEGIRRHLEELNPRIETLGAAGFFGVPINWRALDDDKVTPLCPVVVTPAHEVREVPRQGQDDLCTKHDRRRALRHRIGAIFNQEIRRNLVSSQFLIGLLSPGVLLALIGKVFFPARQTALAQRADALLVPEVATELFITAASGSAPATPENPRLGFTDSEQADRVAAFLRATGLTYGFAPLVVLMGHGSISQNNPHLAAYDCGACSGRHGGPNARAFAAMANRPEVRGLLAEKGISIPADTWFVGAEHNTCNEDILWFDLTDLPPVSRLAFGKLKNDLDAARRLSAHERCRRLASAPRNPTPDTALAHIAERATDFSQARPELGHATNAAAFVGRRSFSQGSFFDRRVFLISYDPTQDPLGNVLESVLLAVGPVGAGINLEYYFSTVNNERFGCGTKVPHNVTGLFGVMEGAASDLRTGLPRQMIEIHEAMRLQIVVEHKTEVLTAIYERQPSLQELIGNGWVLLSAIDPDTGEISMFTPGAGFVVWNRELRPLPIVERSPDWYAGHAGPLPPALIQQKSSGISYA